MKFLHLDNQFTPFQSSIAYSFHTFSGGEPHIRILDSVEEKEVTITLRVRSFNDIGKLLLASDALKHAGAQNLSLIIPYFPGARQDRVINIGEPLTVKVYANMINSIGFKKVSIFDPHSDVAPALINNVQIIKNYHLVRQAVSTLKEFALISPDGGALKKVVGLGKELKTNNIIECSKRRNVLTGDLQKFEVHAKDLNQQICVVVDDICDGGRTFIGLAEELKRKNAGELILVVSHGIFGRGTEELFQHYNRIITTNAFKDVKEEKVEVVLIEELLTKK